MSHELDNGIESKCSIASGDWVKIRKRKKRLHKIELVLSTQQIFLHEVIQFVERCHSTESLLKDCPSPKGTLEASSLIGAMGDHSTYQIFQYTYKSQTSLIKPCQS